MKTKTVVLVGQRGSGKSTMFDVFTDIKIPPIGSTTEYKVAEFNLYGETYRIVDLPGVYSLNPNDPAEKITTDFLLNEEYDIIINVVNSPMLSRSLELTVELLEFGKPMVVALNMKDEAEQHGLQIDAEKLSETLGVPVQFTNARFGKGTKKLADLVFSEIKKAETTATKTLEYTHHLEEIISEISESIKPVDLPNNGSNRFWTIKAIENEKMVPENLFVSMKNKIELHSKEIFESHRIDNYETISYERHHLSMKIAEDISTFVQRSDRTLSEKLDDALLHPIFGNIILVLFFGFYFFTIFIVGNTLTSLVDAPISALADTFAHMKDDNPFLWFTINGAYMGFAGVVGIVLPFFLPLVFLTSLFEDTGYTTRIAFLLDGVMHKIGLHGKSVIPFILGFGCAIPALYATRIIESRRDRILTGMLITFIPCSARIAVIFALTAAFAGPLWALIIFIFIGLVIAISGKALSKIISKPTGMIMEINPLKLPSMSLSLRKTWFKIKDFVKEAIIFLVGGSILLSWIEFFNVGHYLNVFFAPILDFVLGLPEELGSTLIFGFFRKELILVMANQALSVPSLSMLPLTMEQVIVFIVFVSLYFPCFTTLIVLWKEFGVKTAVISSVFSMIVATISGFLFKFLFELF